MKGHVHAVAAVQGTCGKTGQRRSRDEFSHEAKEHRVSVLL